MTASRAREGRGGRSRSTFCPGLSLLVVAGIGSSACTAFGDKRPNIVLVVVDTLRADALGSYGSATPTPHMDSIAADGLRFTRAVAQAPWTVPSLASLVTSRYPVEHGQGTGVGPSSAPLVTLAQRLQASGYATAAFLELASPVFRQGFATFEVPVGNTEQRYRDADRRGPSPTFAMAEAWLRAIPARPFFLMIHTYEAHDYFLGKPRHRKYARARHPSYQGRFKRWRPRPPSEAVGSGLIDEMLAATSDDIAFAKSLYEGGVQVVDEEIGRLDNTIAEMGLKPRTILVLTSDHGEGFAPEHRRVSHGGRLHDDLLRIPLILRWPGRIPAGVEDARVELIDVVPTLLQLADLPAGAGASRTDGGGVRGRPLFALRRGLAPAIFGRRYRPAPNPDQAAFAEESAFVILPSGRRQPTTARQVVLYSGDLKLIRAGGRDELYDLTSDPSEISNLVASRPAQAESLGHRLGLLVRALGEQGEGSRPDVEETLRALGYIR